MEPNDTGNTEVPAQGQNGTGTETSDSVTQEGQGDSYSLADDFLKDIPVTERAIVEKYVKDWDAGVTKKFQEIHGQYEPYKQLGDPAVLQEAMTVRNLLDQNPEMVYSVLKDMFGKEQAEQMVQEAQEEEEQPEWMQAINPLQQQFEQQNKVVQALAEILLNTQQTAQTAQEDRELDALIESVQEKHKMKFDDETTHVFLSLIANGQDGDQAVETIKKIGGQSAQAAQEAAAHLPPVLSGGGTPPPDNDVTKLGSKDIRSLIASVVAAKPD